VPQGAHDDYKWDLILESLLDVRHFTFALNVASLVSRREYLNLDKWLADSVNQHGAEFLRAMVEFLEVKMESEKLSRMTDPAVDSRTLCLNPNHHHILTHTP
jgi:CCR4-NOT transcription complex subunit 1